MKDPILELASVAIQADNEWLRLAEKLINKGIEQGGLPDSDLPQRREYIAARLREKLKQVHDGDVLDDTTPVYTIDTGGDK